VVEQAEGGAVVVGLDVEADAAAHVAVAAVDVDEDA
jgi:hypothetical protein